MLFWQDISDEVIRRDMTVAEAFEVKRPSPIWLVHAYAVTFTADEGFKSPASSTVRLRSRRRSATSGRTATSL
ncbi:MAG: hypothetical protein ACHQ50_13055 [Fimbriimonadales bacterium]